MISLSGSYRGRPTEILVLALLKTLPGIPIVLVATFVPYQDRFIIPVPRPLYFC